MSLTLRKIVKDIENIAASGPASQDFRINQRQIAFWVNETRAMLISQAMTKREDAQDIWQQTIPKIELELQDKSLATDIETDCFILKSTLPIPSTIDGTENYFAVTGIDGTEISGSNLFRAKYKKYNKYTSKRPTWYIRDSYLYIENAKGNMLSFVSATGIFEDPEDLNDFKTATGEVLWDWDSEYPLTIKMATQITDIVVKTKVLPLLQIPRDISNDAQDNGAIIKDSLNR